MIGHSVMQQISNQKNRAKYIDCTRTIQSKQLPIERGLKLLASFPETSNLTTKKVAENNTSTMTG